MLFTFGFWKVLTGDTGSVTIADGGDMMNHELWGISTIFGRGRKA
jgi:hypothetical protein